MATGDNKTAEVVWRGADGADVPLNTFTIYDTLAEMGMEELEVRVDKNNNFIITATSEAQQVKLLAVNELKDGTAIQADDHDELRGTKFVITCPVLRGIDAETILGKLAGQGVIKVEPKKDSNTFVLTCRGEVPERLRVGAITVATRKYVPLPMMCRKCYSYGHLEPTCRNEPSCKECGRGHEGPCSGDPWCRHCEGGHLPTSSDCPAWKQEMTILKLITHKGLPGQKARALYKKEHKGQYLDTSKLVQTPGAKRKTKSKSESDFEGSSSSLRPPPPKLIARIDLESSDEEDGINSSTQTVRALENTSRNTEPFLISPRESDNEEDRVGAHSTPIIGSEKKKGNKVKGKGKKGEKGKTVGK